jgi:hypothetical protein
MRFMGIWIAGLALAALAPAQTLQDAGAMPHFQSGGGWRTTFYLFNTGTAAAQARLNFYDNGGSAQAIPLQLPQVPGNIQTASQFDYTLQPGTVLTVVSDSDDPTGVTGWAHLQTSSATVTGYLIFRYAGLSGTEVQEGVASPEARAGKSYVLGFDNTNSHFDAVALANRSGEAVDVTVTARDALTGAALGAAGTIHLDPMGHTAALLSAVVPATVGTAGSLEFSTPKAGQLAVLGLRFTTPSNAFTSTPPILKQ